MSGGAPGAGLPEGLGRRGGSTGRSQVLESGRLQHLGDTVGPGGLALTGAPCCPLLSERPRELERRRVRDRPQGDAHVLPLRPPHLLRSADGGRPC